MKATLPEIESILDTLSNTASRIRFATKELEDSVLTQAASGWSANDILAHLRSCADVWGQSIFEMLQRDNPRLSDIHPRKWIRQTNYLELDFKASLKAFTRQRNDLLKALKKLSLPEWERSATIGGRKHTIFTQARRMAKHEREHCEQIEKML